MVKNDFDPQLNGCFDCFFWDQSRVDASVRRTVAPCRRTPPRVDWPRTKDVDWCGKWEPLPEEA